MFLFCMRKKGNISLVLLTATIVLLCGGMFLYLALNGKTNAARNVQRVNDRYAAEGAIDIAAECINEYLDGRQNFSISYKIDADFGIYITSTPYDNLYIFNSSVDLSSCNSYMQELGYDPSFEVDITALPNNLKITDIISESVFYNTSHSIGEIVVSVRSKYKGNTVSCDIIYKGILFTHNPPYLVEEGETGHITGQLNMDNAQIEYTNFKNYGNMFK